MKKVLITGGTGFIGSHLIQKLIEQRVSVYLVIRSNSDISCFETLKNEIKFYEYNGTIDSMMNILEESTPELVIHLATNFVVEHGSSDVDRLIASNITFGVHLLEAMVASNIHSFINVGTIWQNREMDGYDPMNLYAATKEAFIDLLKFYVIKHEMKAMTLKLYDTYGPNDNRKKIFKLLKEHSENGQLLELSGGEQQMGPVYIDDVIEAFTIAIKQLTDYDGNGYKEYYIAPETFVTLKQLIDTYQQAVGINLNLQWGKRPYRFREIMVPYRGTPLPNWKPEISLAEGIKKLYRIK